MHAAFTTTIIPWKVCCLVNMKAIVFSTMLMHSKLKYNCNDAQLVKGLLFECDSQSIKTSPAKPAAVRPTKSSSSRVASNQRCKPLISPAPQTMHALCNFVWIINARIIICKRSPWDREVPENAPPAVQPPTTIAAPSQEVGVADLAVNSDRSISASVPHRANESHRGGTTRIQSKSEAECINIMQQAVYMLECKCCLLKTA